MAFRFFLAVFFSLGFQAKAAKFRVLIISQVEGGTFYARALNDTGVWGGFVRSPAGRETGYLGNSGFAVQTGTLGGVNSYVNAVSDGKWSAGSSLDSNAVERAFLFWDNYMEDLSFFQPAGYGASAALGISDQGHVTGWVLAPTGEKRAFTYSQGHWKALPHFDASSVGYACGGATVVGVSRTGDGLERGFIYDANAGVRHVNPSVASALYAIGGIRAGGDMQIGDGRVACMVPVNGAMEMVWNLGTLGGKNSKVLAMNSYHRAVGQAEDAQGRRRAFYYRNGTMYDLNTLIDGRQPAVLTSAFAINGSEAILAEGSYGGEAAQFYLTLEEPFTDSLRFDGGLDIWERGVGLHNISFTVSGTAGTKCITQVSRDLVNWEDMSGTISIYEWGGGGPITGGDVDGTQKFFRLKEVTE